MKIDTGAYLFFYLSGGALLMELHVSKVAHRLILQHFRSLITSAVWMAPDRDI
jgi:hypothetical protein